MLNKYKFITIIEGEFCKIIIIVLWTDTEAFTIFKCFSISNNMLTNFVVSLDN